MSSETPAPPGGTGLGIENTNCDIALMVTNAAAGETVRRDTGFAVIVYAGAWLL